MKDKVVAAMVKRNAQAIAEFTDKAWNGWSDTMRSKIAKAWRVA